MMVIKEKGQCVEVLTLEDVAREAGVVRTTVYFAIRVGDLFAYKVSPRTWLVTREAADAWLASRRGKANAQ